MDSAQQNYTTTKKELLAVVFALDKFRSYLLDSKIIVFFDHAALEEARCQTETIRWMLLLQEFDLEIRDKKGAENSVTNHLSRIEKESELMPIRDEFTDEQLLHINSATPWFADICNYVATSHFPLEASRPYKEKLQSDAKYYIWDDPYLWRLCSNKVICKCIPKTEISSILQFCHSAPGSGHYGSTWTGWKVLDCGLYWPTIFKDAYHFVSTCKRCQKVGAAMNRRHEMPQHPILFYEGIDFMGPFPVSNGLVCRKRSSVTKGVTSATEPWPPFFRNMGWHTRLLQHITPKQTTKLRCLIGKSSKHYKRGQIPVGRTRADSSRTLYGHIEMHTKRC
ncbi:putative mitochondrial protein, partial [Mucuna pruriens]